MANRQDKQRQVELEPKRINFAVEQIEKLGYKVTFRNSTRIEFEYNGSKVEFYPYSVWHTGKSIVDGRGIEKLLKQLK